MASKIVRDSHLAIFVETVDVPAATKSNDFVAKGAVRGLAGYDAKLGSDGKSYVNVDTAAEIRVDGVTGAFATGDSVYVKADGTGWAKATGADLLLIGRAVRPKTAAAGKLFIQLIPQAA